MPAKTAKQYRLMAAIAHGAKPKGGKGPSREVAKEFVKETPPAKRREFMAQLKGRGKRR